MNRLTRTVLVTFAFLGSLLPHRVHAVSLAVCDEASLRAAIAQGGEIQFDCDGTIVLTNTLIITNDVTLDATGHAVTLSGGDAVRLFTVNSNASLTLLGLKLVNGRAINTGGAIFNQGSLLAAECTFDSNSVFGMEVFPFWVSAEGGAVWNGGVMTVRQCVFVNNKATGIPRGGFAGLGEGGAIFNVGMLIGSEIAFHSNTARGSDGPPGPNLIFLTAPGAAARGGAICNGRSGVFFSSDGARTVAIQNSTFASNSCIGGKGAGGNVLQDPNGGGGGGALGGGIYNDGSLSMTNCTSYGNTTTGGQGGAAAFGGSPGANGQGLGGGLAHDGGAATLAFCTLAANTATNGGAIYRSTNSVFLTHTILSHFSPNNNCSGPVIDAGYNLSSDASAAFTAPSSRNSINPGLGALFNNGGPTLTLALIAGSPAIDAGDSTGFPATDQRGVVRPSGTRCDIGAFEGSLNVPGVTPAFVPSATSLNGVVALDVTVRNSNSVSLSSMRLTIALSSSLGVANGPVISDGFNGSVTAVQGNRTIELNGFSLLPTGVCMVRVPVAANQVGLGTASVTAFRSDQTAEQGISATASLSIAGPPSGQTLAATGAGFTNVVLHGTINLGGAETVVWFEYGTDTSFGQSTPPQTYPSGFVATPALALVEGLARSTDYYFRIVASNQAGIFHGNTQTFFTLGDVAVCDEAHLRANLVRGGAVRIACDGQITLSNTMVVSIHTEIDATGRQFSLSGGDVRRVLEVAADAGATLRNVTITRGRGSQGAGIFNQGKLLLDHCVLTANQAIGQAGINGTTGTSPGSSGGPGGMGGPATGAALHNTGFCTAEWTTFSSNVVVGGTGGTGGAGNSTCCIPTLGGAGGFGGAAAGGAIFNANSLVLSNCCLFQNRALGGRGGDGGIGIPGGLRVFAGPGGLAYGGSIRNEQQLTLLNVTVAENEAKGGDLGAGSLLSAEGGNALGGGIGPISTATLEYCTIALNRSVGGLRIIGSPAGQFPFVTNQAPGLGGGIAVTSTVVLLQGVFLAHAPAHSNCFGTITDRGNNASSDDSCAFTAASSLSNIEPRLGPLRDNGGPTLTMALLPGSPAINAGSETNCPDTDQRGGARPAHGRCDIGAYEMVMDSFGLISITKEAAGARLRGYGPPGGDFAIQTSSQLVTWDHLANASVQNNGLFDVTVPVSATHQFFRTGPPNVTPP